MKVKLKIRFPCGYQVEYELRTISLSVSSTFGLDDLPVCPIHKDKCKA